VIFDEFLVLEELRALMRFAWERRDDFDASRVVGAGGRQLVDDSYRRSRVLFELGAFRDLFSARISAFLPFVFYGLSHPPFEVADIEVQLTATEGGGFFARHNDNGAEALAGRTITFVYFFHSEPRGYGGGDLCLFETAPGGSEAPMMQVCLPIAPQQNQIVFFPSGAQHEVRPVSIPSGRFIDSRFTVNGWLHR
jgi:Rps23 Pro-64 3,4-dihydroxylase Tpa1-like proline 4-hydroxylase